MAKPIATLPLTAALLLLVLAGCKDKEDAKKPDEKPEVDVVTLRARAVPLLTDLPGRTSAFRIAEVRPQVNGVILKRLFTEGDEVKAGQLLYQIDPAPYQATLATAQAALQRAQAGVRNAQATVNRYRPLAAASAISRLDLDNSVGALQQGQADVGSAQASIKTAAINLAYTRVTAPITGRTGRSAFTEGALVTASQTALLVTVTQLNPVPPAVVETPC